MAESPNHDSLIMEFCGLTGLSPSDAQQYLETAGWDLSGAVAEYYTAQEEEDGGTETKQETSEAYTGPRTLDGRPAPQSALPSSTSASRTSKPPARKGVATLGSLSAGGESSHAGHGHADDDDDDTYSDDENGQPRDLFAGGEKSGLAVQDPRRNDPRNIVNDLLKKAQSQAPRPGASSVQAPTTRFRGTGMTLGGDDTPSQSIPDPHASTPQRGPPQRRVLHLWADGFSVEDGPLRRYDDPRNAADLAFIQSGRAPLHLMNVTADQEVDVILNKHDENYVAPRKAYKPFSGGGQRLGSPTPSASPSAPPASAPSNPASTSTRSTSMEQPIDASQPTVSVRIQLADGTRLPARFNTTQTIGDIYEFIDRADPGSRNRAWVIATTFPSKDHTDRSAVLGEVPEFKKGGIAVQKWV